MTKTKTILGVSFAAIFVISMMASPAFAGAHPDWLTILSSTVEAQNAKVTKATIVADDDIPRNTDVFGGYGFPITGNDDWAVLGITTHDPARDSHQNPVGWHPHLVNADGAGCITGVSEGTHGGINIQGDTLTIHIANKQIGGTITSGEAFSFLIVPDAGCASGLKLV